VAPFWTYPITQAHGVGGEQGVDYGTPFHTPLADVLPGTVSAVDCTPGWRCEVDVQTQFGGQPAVESYLHVDQPAVQVGQQVSTGDLIGLSGGQLSGGSNPDVQPYSTGPHVEYDIFRGTQPWQNAIDPTAFLASIGTGGNLALTDSGNQLLLSPGPGLPNNNPNLKPGGNPGNIQGPGFAINLPDPWAGFQGAVAGTAGAAKGWATGTVAPWATRNVIALAVAAVVILVIFGSGQRQQGGQPSIIPVPV
jgi:hypothetical protein